MWEEGLEAGTPGCEGRSFFFGLLRSPQEWHQLALVIPFAMDRLRFVRPWKAKAMVEMLTNSPARLVELRKNALQKMIEQVEKLEKDERVLHDSVAPHVQKILHDKKLVLLSRLMTEAGVDDLILVDEVINGFDLTGCLKVSGQFPAVKGGELIAKTRDQLLVNSVGRVALVVSFARQSKTPDDDVALLAECDDEVARSWVTGPFSRDQFDCEFGRGGWVAAHRFVIHQSSGGVLKRRLIDDFSISGQNDTIVPSERLDHSGLAEVVALAKLLGRCIELGSVDFVDAAGGGWLSSVHPGWMNQKLHIRTLDLRNAYKQLAVSSNDGCVSIICAYQ